MQQTHYEDGVRVQRAHNPPHRRMIIARPGRLPASPALFHPLFSQTYCEQVKRPVRPVSAVRVNRPRESCAAQPAGLKRIRRARSLQTESEIMSVCPRRHLIVKGYHRGHDARAKLVHSVQRRRVNTDRKHCACGGDSAGT